VSLSACGVQLTEQYAVMISPALALVCAVCLYIMHMDMLVHVGARCGD